MTSGTSMLVMILLEPPVRVYLPDERMPFWRVRAETQNRPLVRELELDANTGVDAE